MNSRWHRSARILEVPKQHPWWKSHAQLPTVLRINDRLWRICLSGRDVQNRANVVIVDVDPTRDMAVRSVSEDRPLPYGGPGAIDRDGVGVTCVLAHAGRQMWIGGSMNVRDHDRYRISSFWLTSPDDGRSFERVAAPPFLVAGPDNPLGAGMAQVLWIEERWHMWFTSMRPWRSTDGGPPEPTYDIRHAVSDDLHDWVQDPEPAIALDRPREAGIVRPWVVRGPSGFEMWYSVRGPASSDPNSRNYRIGYATSADAQNWERHDERFVFENPPEPGDWDSDMQCYPTIVEDGGRRYLFYSGNGFGRDGFGYAVSVTDGER